METKKQKAIREAYGNYADIALELCNENGWIEQFDYHNYFPQNKEEKRIDGQLFRRPKSLQGIETNNGWICILSESDLPKETDGIYWVLKDNEIECIELRSPIFFDRLYSDFVKDKITHYQPIIKPQPPIY